MKKAFLFLLIPILRHFSTMFFITKDLLFYDIISEEQFIDICSKYLGKYKNKSVAIPDFISVVDSTMNKSYSSFFDTWLHTVDFHVLLVKETEYDEEN